MQTEPSLHDQMSHRCGSTVEGNFTRKGARIENPVAHSCDGSQRLGWLAWRAERRASIAGCAFVDTPPILARAPLPFTGRRNSRSLAYLKISLFFA
jgi:hypothetical protein